MPIEGRSPKSAVCDFNLRLDGKLEDGEFDITPIESGVIVVLRNLGISFILNSTPSGEIKPAQRYNNRLRRWENLVMMSKENLIKIKKLAIEKIMEDDTGSIAWLKRQT